jgi:hypothetical protein
VSVTLARRRDRSNSAFNHRLIWLRQHVQRYWHGPVNVASVRKRKRLPLKDRE